MTIYLLSLYLRIYLRVWEWYYGMEYVEVELLKFCTWINYMSFASYMNLTSRSDSGENYVWKTKLCIYTSLLWQTFLYWMQADYINSCGTSWHLSTPHWI